MTTNQVQQNMDSARRDGRLLRPSWQVGVVSDIALVNDFLAHMLLP